MLSWIKILNRKDRSALKFFYRVWEEETACMNEDVRITHYTDETSYEVAKSYGWKDVAEKDVMTGIEIENKKFFENDIVTFTLDSYYSYLGIVRFGRYTVNKYYEDEYHYGFYIDRYRQLDNEGKAINNTEDVAELYSLTDSRIRTIKTSGHVYLSPDFSLII